MGLLSEILKEGGIEAAKRAIADGTVILNSEAIIMATNHDLSLVELILEKMPDELKSDPSLYRSIFEGGSNLSWYSPEKGKFGLKIESVRAIVNHMKQYLNANAWTSQLFKMIPNDCPLINPYNSHIKDKEGVIFGLIAAGIVTTSFHLLSTFLSQTDVIKGFAQEKCSEDSINEVVKVMFLHRKEAIAYEEDHEGGSPALLAAQEKNWLFLSALAKGIIEKNQHDYKSNGFYSTTYTAAPLGRLLIKAMAAQEWTTAKLLIEAGAGVDSAYVYFPNDRRYDFVALHLAALHDQAELFQLLLAKGAELGKSDSENMTALELAVKHQSSGILDGFLASKQISELGGYERVLMQAAIKNNDVKLLRKLLNLSDASFISHWKFYDAHRYYYEGVLHAAVKSGHASVITCFLIYGIDLTVKDWVEKTALERAAMENKLSLFNPFALIYHYLQSIDKPGTVDFDRQENDFVTLLAGLSSGLQPDGAINWQIYAPGDFNFSGSLFSSKKSTARYHELQQQILTLENSVRAKLLEEFNDQFKSREHPVARRMTQGIQVKLAEQATSDRVATPQAILGHGLARAEMLLKAGVPTQGLLHYAVAQNNCEMVKLLLEYHASLAWQENGQTALQLAEKTGHKGCIAILGVYIAKAAQTVYEEIRATAAQEVTPDSGIMERIAIYGARQFYNPLFSPPSSVEIAAKLPLDPEDYPTVELSQTELAALSQLLELTEEDLAVPPAPFSPG